MKNTVKAVVIIAIAAAAALIAIGPIRLHMARKEADTFAAENKIEIKYEGNEDLNSREAFLTEIWQIALWEENTRKEINTVFARTDKEYNAGYDEIKGGYEKAEELRSFAMKEKWRNLRKSLDKTVTAAVASAFEKADGTYGLDEQSVMTCYEKDCFYKIKDVMQAVED